MKLKDTLELKDAIKKRKSIREFGEGELTPIEKHYIRFAANTIPSAGGLYPLNLILVEGIPNYFIITARFEKTTAKYGERGLRYVFMEAGHMAQNISLICVELDLACYCIGAFNDREVRERLGDKIAKEETPIYIVAVGRKK